VVLIGKYFRFAEKMKYFLKIDMGLGDPPQNAAENSKK
jgi:hypothetical protein